MRKIALVLAASAVLATACSGDDGGSADQSTTSASSTETTAAAPESTTASTSPVSTVAPLPKPSVSIPATAPTELVVTDLVEGTGEPAAAGDQVVVHYVGVRIRDGVEFDNSYDRNQPFPVSLGAGGVIQGWDQGLVGVKAGGRRQLDIPSALAYGDRAQGDKIGPNEDLTFVIDVLAVVKPIDASKEPSLVIAPSDPVTEVKTVDLVEGTGAEAKAGGTATIAFQFFRADTGAKLYSSWTTPQGIPLVLIPDGQLDGLLQGIEGMKVGGRRQITIPAASIFGGQGNAGIGLDPGVDAVVVVDLLATY